MKKIRFGANFTVFVLFFGIATIEAVQNQHWFKSVFWLLAGLCFLAADNFRQRGRP